MGPLLYDHYIIIYRYYANYFPVMADNRSMGDIYFYLSNNETNVSQFLHKLW